MGGLQREAVGGLQFLSPHGPSNARSARRGVTPVSTALWMPFAHGPLSVNSDTDVTLHWAESVNNTTATVDRWGMVRSGS